MIKVMNLEFLLNANEPNIDVLRNEIMREIFPLNFTHKFDVQRGKVLLQSMNLLCIMLLVAEHKYCIKLLR